jgi:hypothetical protein
VTLAVLIVVYTVTGAVVVEVILQVFRQGLREAGGHGKAARGGVSRSDAEGSEIPQKKQVYLTGPTSKVGRAVALQVTLHTHHTPHTTPHTTFYMSYLSIYLSIYLFIPYVCVCVSLSLSLSLSIYIPYMYVYLYMYVGM